MERKIFNFESKILIDETIEHYGYHPDKYGPSSLKFILCSCRYCGRLAAIRKAFFNKAGSACHKECRLKEQSECGSPFKNESVRAKAKQTIQERYGVEYASQNAEVANRISGSRKKSHQVQYSPAFHGVVQFLTDNSIAFEVQDSVIVVPERKYAISCHWNDDLLEHKDRYRCQRQTQHYAADGIQVFHIFEHLWPARSRQILNFISGSLGLNHQKVAARKCRLDFSSQPRFFDHFHIQGAPALVLRYFNLVYDGEVVGSMTASRHHRQNVNGNAVVLSRLCFADNCNVQGGSSRLLGAFREWAVGEGYGSILSWSDNAWTSGRVYNVMGFELGREYGPDYFYWNSDRKEFRSKQSQKKSNTGCPEGMTERDWCLQNNLCRIWDVGKRKWFYRLQGNLDA